MQIPEKGLSKEQVLGTLHAFKSHDMDWKSGKVFCYVYNPGEDSAGVVKRGLPVIPDRERARPDRVPVDAKAGNRRGAHGSESVARR